MNGIWSWFAGLGWAGWVILIGIIVLVTQFAGDLNLDELLGGGGDDA